MGGSTMTIFSVLDTLIRDLPVLREVHAKNAKFNVSQPKRLVPVSAHWNPVFGTELERN